MKLKELVGSGNKIGLSTLPFLIIGLILNVIFTNARINPIVANLIIGSIDEE
jgi:hypothetical protein